MSKTVCVIQARMGSTRLPGKVLMPLGEDDRLVLDWVIDAARSVNDRTLIIDEIVVATSTLYADNAIEDYVSLTHEDVTVIRGSESDVLARFVKVAEETDASVLIRLTGDCPFHDSNVIAQVIKLRQMTGADYASNVDPATWPDGLDVEVFTRKALMEAHAEATRASDRDCVTRFISRNRHRYKAANLVCPLPGMHRERWVLDTKNDYAFCQEIAKRLDHLIDPPSYIDILDILDKNPELREINKIHPRNERFYEALATEPQEARKCPTSSLLLAKAEELIPLGTQTFSKSKLQYPDGSPLFVTHGDGAYVYDADGNDYVDLVSGLLPNVLGYRDPDVDQAIRDQLNRGISFSTSTTLEHELAKRLCSYIPCAEMVRFGKTGTDVTTAAVRLARAHTGKDFVLKARGGYHGWAAWSTALDPTRSLGTRDDGGCVGLFDFGDMGSIHKLIPNKTGCAAIIVEPETNPEFLVKLRDYCKDTGTILIFDEVITGFRFSVAGAQFYRGVVPDLACFGKAMGNGMPISAIVGKREIMKTMEKICFSGTFFGETLSLAASIATIDKMVREDVPKHLATVGAAITNRARALAEKHGVSEYISFHGHPAMTRITYKTPAVREFVMKRMIEQGVLLIASHNVSYAIKNAEVLKISKAYDETFAALRAGLDNKTFDATGQSEIAPTVRGAA